MKRKEEEKKGLIIKDQEEGTRTEE